MKRNALILALWLALISACVQAQTTASMVQIGTLANRPAVGALYFITDDGQQRLTYWNGTTWIDVAPGLTSSGLLSVSSHPAMTGDVTTAAGSVNTAIGASKVTNSMLAGSIDLATKVTGVLPAASHPALTGDVTTSAGSTATTIKSSVSLTTPNINVATGTCLAVTGAVTSSGTAGVGYATGAGGSVVQATSKSTGVTLNKITGTITMNAAALAAGAIVTFTVTDSAAAATDVIVAQHDSVGTTGAYTVAPNTPAAGSFKISIRNNTAGSLSEAIIIRFAIIKSVVN